MLIHIHNSSQYVRNTKVQELTCFQMETKEQAPVDS